MAPLSGHYDLVSHDNPLGEARLMFAALSGESIQRVADPANRREVILVAGHSALTITTRHSLVPEANTAYTCVYGREMAGPGGPTLLVTKEGDNKLTKVVRDGNTVVTITLTVIGSGLVVRVMANTVGYVCTVVFKRRSVSVCGLYLLENTSNVDQLFQGHPDLTDSVLRAMFRDAALRIRVSESGVYEMVDYLGTGAVKRVNFRLGEEFEWRDPDLGVNCVCVVSQPSPGCLVYVTRDSRTGKAEVWRLEATEAGITCWVERPGATTSTFQYRRVPDIIGKWQKVRDLNPAAQAKTMAELGVPPEMAAKYQAETGQQFIGYIEYKTTGKQSMRFEPVCGGVWKYETESAPLSHPPMLFRLGDEHSTNIEGLPVMAGVCTLTRDSFMEIKRMNGKECITQIKVTKDLALVENVIVGRAETRCQTVYARA